MGKIEYISPNNAGDIPKSEDAVLASLDWQKDSGEGSFFSISTHDDSEVDRNDMAKLILIVIFVIIIFVVAIFGFASAFTSSGQLHISEKTQSALTTKKGKTEAHFEIGQPYQREYRVYEIILNKNDDPLNFFNATLIALPLSQAKAILETDGSEIDAKIKAKHIPVIVAENDQIKTQLENYTTSYLPLILSIKGNTLVRKEIYFKNKLTSINPQDFDDHEYLLIDSIKEIDWQSKEINK